MYKRVVYLLHEKPGGKETKWTSTSVFLPDIGFIAMIGMRFGILFLEYISRKNNSSYLPLFISIHDNDIF